LRFNERSSTPTPHARRHVDEVRGDEPDPQFVSTDDAARQQIVRAIVAPFGRALRLGPSFLEHDLVLLHTFSASVTR
jgi:hypothetical protein